MILLLSMTMIIILFNYSLTSFMILRYILLHNCVIVNSLINPHFKIGRYDIKSSKLAVVNMESRVFLGLDSVHHLLLGLP